MNRQMLFDEHTEFLSYPQDSVRKELEMKFKNRMREELKLRSLISYVGNKEVPFLRLYRYKEAFSFGLVRYLFKKLDVNPKDYIFDPFSGLGTTMFTAMIHGIPSIGADKLPLAHFISKTLPMFLSLSEGELKDVWESAKFKVKDAEPAEIALDVPIMQVAFDREVLWTLRKLKSIIQDLSYPYNDILFYYFSLFWRNVALLPRMGNS
ncbi:MAG: hypothetical protein GXO39_01305 [Thermotogae bacterium]|nr:hypothetical protein [Thermotogota bacterium]